MRETLPDVTERMGAAGLEPLHTEATDELRARLGLHLERIGGTMVSVAAEDPSILLNRAIGLGLTEPATPEAIERICATYRDHGIERFYLGVHPDARPDGLEQMLADAGLESGRGWMKFERGPEPAPTADSDLEVREIGEDHVDAFGRIAASGFGLTDAAAPLFRGLVDRPDIHLYMTFDGETPAGTGLLYVNGNRAWFDWAPTDPAFASGAASERCWRSASRTPWLPAVRGCRPPPARPSPATHSTPITTSSGRGSSPRTCARTGFRSRSSHGVRRVSRRIQPRCRAIEPLYCPRGSYTSGVARSVGSLAGAGGSCVPKSGCVSSIQR